MKKKYEKLEKLVVEFKKLEVDATKTNDKMLKLLEKITKTLDSDEFFFLKKAQAYRKLR